MTAIEDVRERMRREDASVAGPLGRALRANGVRLAALGGPLEERWHQAVVELAECIAPIDPDGEPVLSEGGVYLGSWIESTGTISAEILSRFAPEVAAATFRQFAAHQRDDGLIPYKITAAGPGFSQIQIVTPLARSVWNHYLVTGRDRAFLADMYAAMTCNDEWLARHRDTLGTGGVEAFCTFDTGHDLSPRFWFAPDRCLHGDAARVDPTSTAVPVVAPDLTANVAAQREHLALIAAELGDDPGPWRARADDTLRALWEQCWDEADGLFYDRDAHGGRVRIASDVLLRVLACDVGDAGFFAAALERYLMNTGKFLAHYGFTSLAMDDPRFDHDFRRNSWGGPVNFLSLVRAPHAFERHGRVAELGLVSSAVLGALVRADRFPQCLDPWTGEAGFTQMYSPSILWLLDAVERWFGILERPDGEVWFSGLAPTRLEHGAAPEAVAYARIVDGTGYELAADDETVAVFRDDVALFSFPRGWRVVADRSGVPTAIVGLAGRTVTGAFVAGDQRVELAIAPNERVELDGLRIVAREAIGFVAPRA